MNEQSSVQFTENKDVMTLYIDTAKTFLNLSTGVLALTITFQEKIAGLKPGAHINWRMAVAWFFYLLVIISSAFYQYLAVKFIDSFSQSPGKPGMFKGFEKNPGWIYGSMVGFFFLGSLSLVLAVAVAIP